MLSFANAKINLGLHVVHKRSDGYHDLETIFYPVKIYDAVEITPSKSGEITFHSDGIPIPGHGANLCEKAYKLLKQDFDIPAVTIHLIKQIPIGAGLGGGSADAAFVLKMLNETFNLDITTTQLQLYAKQLGADCPFFIENKPVYATGIGTDFSPIDLDLSTYYMVLINPNIHIATAEAYRGVQVRKSEFDLKSITQLPIQEWKYYLKNDFEEGIFEQFPKIKKLKEALYTSGALFASMSGSGSSVYGLFEKPIVLDHLKEFGDIYYPIDL
ncbi:4-(cytidine 5'-diphospho)-2-C-methyl-D-erythritol kinase [Sphingobacterium sp. SRCM116780]|uniref:4-(cytidine 5'-diphospho)-2-C-methyl-D-erythritol kinase n=1 Tax=Sphingobacterium sp. SRCM116780 TaxID=2907623 RepID=UPI001F277A09|nr:4-(cytidine 5'-diphospho)-2-C-methyl-D-erythritol kinase [Sphingobacterium sp. SRCM116780]UIR57634.1 4-(cytidine 5'-diphospho)-2-C-methyl-D-erythritol kinase [Sphingobacterium sp. SRCM116780]